MSTSRKLEHLHTLDEKLHRNEKSRGETPLKRGGAWPTADVGIDDLPQHLQPPALAKPSWAQLGEHRSVGKIEGFVSWFCQNCACKKEKESEKKLKESETENWGRRNHKAGCQLRGIWRHFLKSTIFRIHTFFWHQAGISWDVFHLLELHQCFFGFPRAQIQNELYN